MASDDPFISRIAKIMHLVNEKEKTFINEDSVEQLNDEKSIDDYFDKQAVVDCGNEIHLTNLDDFNKDQTVLMENDDMDADPSWLPEHNESSSSDESIISDISSKPATISTTLMTYNTSVEDTMVAELVGANEKGLKKRTRKRTSDPENWARNITKKRRSELLPYTTKKGLQQAKGPQPVNCSNCKFKCAVSFNEEDRVEFCREYWKLQYTRKKDFILKNVVETEPTRIKKRPVTGKNRKSSRSYFLHKNGKKVRVCQNFFLKTLAISDGPVIHAFKSVNDKGIFSGEDSRGKQTPVNKTSAEAIERVKSHIESFPVMESHYCRRSSTRLYLDSTLSISKMFELYKMQCDNDGVKPVKQLTYRRVFCNNYNLSFFKPKKDQCLTCLNYRKAEDANKQALEENYLLHKEREKKAVEAKCIDKEKSMTDDSYLAATFDLQKVLQMPITEASQMYYLRKLNVYNLCIYEFKPTSDAHCLVWSEINGKRGSSEIGSSLYWWIHQLPPTVKQLSLFSDSCGGQNRNQHIAALFLYIVQNSNLDVIEQKFMESGHSYMEVDSMHSAIEEAQRNIPVYSMMDWLNIFRFARSSRKKKTAKPYKVKELLFNDMVDLIDLSNKIIKNRNKDEFGKVVSWLKVKCLKYEKCLPGVIQYRYDYSSPYIKIFTYQQTRGRIIANVSLPKQLTKAYNRPLPISNEKKHDLQKMCKSGIIPQELHSWYLNVPATGTHKNRLPEPSLSEDESE